MLADLGADVIEIESPAGDPGRTLGLTRGGTTLPVGHTAYFENGNRNKRSIVLDLNRPSAREVVYKLVERSDVFIQNYRKGVAERLGMGYEDLKKRNERIIYASGNTFGPKGPARTCQALTAWGKPTAG
jgi:crotonobetainyl-CoA:carnitine CoA-transferase CaiB-like acyl-CoA transferase